MRADPRTAPTDPDTAPASCPLCGESGGADNLCAYCNAARRPGGYVTRRLVAQGPHSRLYKATAPDGRRVALKELVFARVPGVKELEAFEREAKVLRSVAHPQIPRVLATFTEGRGANTRQYLVQEFVEGESLQDRLQKGRIPERDARDVARRILPVLAYLHTREPPLVHRDVKPANVVQRPDGELVLVDFGAARDLARGETHGATLVGTFGYMPLEQLGGTVDPTADLYALGMTLVHLLTGREPADLLRDGIVDVRAVVKGSPSFVEWLARITAKRREARFQSATEALEALDTNAAFRPASSEASTELVIVPIAKRRHCGACGLETPGDYSCASCGAALLPADLPVLQVLSSRPGEGRTYLAKDPVGRRVVVREHLLQLDVELGPLAAHVETIEAHARDPIAGLARVRSVRLEGPEEDRRLMVLRDYVEGTPLDELLRTRPLAEGEIRSLATTVLGVLANLHARVDPEVAGVLAPRNLVLGPDGTWTITDTLLTATVPRSATRRRDGRGVLAKREVYVATAERDRPPEPTGDVFALGAILLQLTRHTPVLDEARLAGIREEVRAHTPIDLKAWEAMPIPDGAHLTAFAAFLTNPDRARRPSAAAALALFTRSATIPALKPVRSGLPRAFATRALIPIGSLAGAGWLGVMAGAPVVAGACFAGAIAVGGWAIGKALRKDAGRE